MPDAGVNLHISLFNEDQVAARLLQTAGRVSDAQPWFQMMLHHLERQLDRQFATSGKHFNSNWKALSPAYAKAKAAAGYGNKPILERTGELRKSLTQSGGHAVRIATPHQMVFGSTVVSSGKDREAYGAVHQNGSKDGRIPQRRILDLMQRSDYRREGTDKRRIARSLGLFVARGIVQDPTEMRGK